MPTDRSEYYKQRTKKLISFIIDDENIKTRMKEAAKADGRTVIGWFRFYILPLILPQIEAQLKKAPGTE